MDVDVTSQPIRYREIDLFRAIAILMVIAFHYLSRWTPPRSAINLYPYGDAFAGNAIINHGHLGVDFFFIISGFVIAMTLESCRGPMDFAVRRAARLLPAMIVCSLLTLIFVKVFSRVPEFHEQASVWNLLPSWTFTPPEVWARFLPVTEHVDGAYWSLVVEAKFYVWAALIYFLQREQFARNMFMFCAVTSLVYIAAETFRVRPLQSLEFYLLFGRTAMLFAAGVMFYQLHKRPGDLGKFAPYLAACFALEMAQLMLVPRAHETFVVTAAFKLIFLLAFLAVALGWRAPNAATFSALARIGLASYPLYLLHQNIGVTLINNAGSLQEPVVVVASVAAVLIGLIAVSSYLQKLIEEPGKRLLLSRLRPQQIR
jgi:peptidoglycan/LPS O-acetylase OafA/YrhL